MTEQSPSIAKIRLVVIGGGAAGFFCAVNAARMNPAMEVVIIEKTGKLLTKVKVSGGGRCNVTHSCFSIAELVRKYPRGAGFLKKAFHHFYTTHTINWFQDRGIALKTEADGRMFPVSNTSQTIIDCLMQEAARYRVKIMTNLQVRELLNENDKWTIAFSAGPPLKANYVCVASGGFPKFDQFDWLQKLGHTVAAPVPSLFTFNMPGNPIVSLMGITVEHVRVKITGTKLSEEGPVLITHWGMSGPAILRLSAWGARELSESKWQFGMLVNWLPAHNEQTLKERFQSVRFEIAAQRVVNRNPFGLPQRLWEFLVLQSGVNENLRWADLPAKEQNRLIKNICAGEFAVNGKTTFREEFVTAGGISLSEVDENTMESRKMPNLFFAGEVLDVDGITGGFNFQNAWTTGWIAAKAISERSRGSASDLTNTN